MKKILNIILGVSILGSVSCSKDFLEKDKIGEQTIGTFYKTNSDAEKAANATYAYLWNYRYVSSNFGFGNITTDDAVKGSEPGDLAAYLDLERFNILPSNLMINWKYPQVFRGINACNFAIQAYDGTDIPTMDKEVQLRVLGEAKFMRAFWYFDAVRTWGDLPIIEKPLQLDEMNQERQPAKDVYAFIEKDLRDAIELLPKKSEYAPEHMGKATQGAAQALLAKVMIYQASPGFANRDFYNSSKYAEAKTVLENLFNSGEYHLYTGDFYDIFQESGENGPGSIFEIQFTAISDASGDTFNNNGNFTTVLTMPRGPWGWGLQQPTYDLYAAYENGDPRRDATIITTDAVIAEEKAYKEGSYNIVDDVTKLHNLKNYLTPAERAVLKHYKNSPVNERVMRLADMYLLYAEACYHTGDESMARDYVNMVRSRVGLADINSSGQNLLNDIYNERRLELALENHRFWDLTRWGLMEKVIKEDGYFVGSKVEVVNNEYVVTSDGSTLNVTNYNPEVHTLMPLPQSEIDATNGVISQNPGY